MLTLQCSAALNCSSTQRQANVLVNITASHVDFLCFKVDIHPALIVASVSAIAECFKVDIHPALIVASVSAIFCVSKLISVLALL